MKKASLAIIGVLVVVLGIVANSALFTVHQTTQALILQFGNPIRVVKEPGLHVKMPFLQNAELFDG
ncbi:MAG: protease modulator HflC, partial [Rhodospirillaceae bacterium]|nr:protease modulator HflC [Rhodospirillaceae bacterium]